MLSAELVEDAGRLDALTPEWDELAVASSRPMAAPAWMLGWLRRVAGEEVVPRCVAVWDGETLVGIGPFFVDLAARGRIDYRLLGEAMPRGCPLTLPGREWEVAEAICLSLSSARPRPDAIALESLPLDAPWGQALQQRWPGLVSPLWRQYFVQGSPTVALSGGSLDGWLKTRSSNFRGQMRRLRRRFEAQGGIARMSTSETIERDLSEFMRLHEARWQGRGSSSIVAMGDRFRAMLSEVARSHLKDGRFRLWMLDIEGRTISAQLFAAAGGEVLYVNGGWDEGFAELKPAMLGILCALEDALLRGDRRLDLAPGENPYKLRFADGNDPVAWSILLVPGRRLVLSCARTAPMLGRVALREAAKRSLPPGALERGRRLRAMVAGD